MFNNNNLGGRSITATSLKERLAARQAQAKKTLADSLADELQTLAVNKKVYVTFKNTHYAVTDCIKTSGYVLILTDEDDRAVNSGWLRKELLECSGLPVKIEIEGKEYDPKEIKDNKIMANKNKGIYASTDEALEDLSKEDTNAEEDKTHVAITTDVIGAYLTTTPEGLALASALKLALLDNNIELTADNLKSVMASMVDNLDLHTEPQTTESASLSTEDKMFKAGLDKLNLDCTVSTQNDKDLIHYSLVIEEDLTISQAKKLDKLIKSTYNIIDEPEIDEDEGFTNITFTIKGSVTTQAKGGLEDDGLSDDSSLLAEGSQDLTVNQDFYDNSSWEELTVEVATPKSYSQLANALPKFKGEVLSNPSNKPNEKLQRFKTNDPTGFRLFVDNIQNNLGITVLAKKKNRFLSFLN